MSNINEVQSKPRLYVSVNLFWSMAAKLRDSVAAVVVVVVVVRPRPRVIPLAMITDKIDRSQKPQSMRIQFPPSNVSKWRTTNKISPRI